MALATSAVNLSDKGIALPTGTELGYLTEVDCVVTTIETKERSQTFHKYKIRDDDVIDTGDSDEMMKASCVV